MNKFKNGELNACAESAMMGSVIRVWSPEDAVYMCGYIARTICEMDDEQAVVYGKYIYDSAMKYNTNGTPIQFITTSRAEFGNLITLVRDETLKDLDHLESLTTPDGVLAYVYNTTYPDCSELGYVFFGNKHGRIVRIG